MRIPVGGRRLLWRARYRYSPRLSSSFRRLLIRLTHNRGQVDFRGPVHIGPGFRLNMSPHGQLIIGPGVDFRGSFNCELSGSGRVVIGAGTTFAAGAQIQCTTSIEIGERCSFGPYVLIVDGYHKYKALDRHWLEQGYDYRPIRIADGAGVSNFSTVQADIGTRAMIGSGSVVHRPIPQYCVAVGNPARVVKYFGPPDQRPEPGRRQSRPRAAD